MAAPATLHADRRHGRTYTAADRRRSGKTSTHGRLTVGHLFANPFFHHLDGRDHDIAFLDTVARLYKPLDESAGLHVGAKRRHQEIDHLPRTRVRATTTMSAGCGSAASSRCGA